MTVKIKSERHKKCFMKRNFKFENYKDCLEATHLDVKISCLKEKILT